MRISVLALPAGACLGGASAAWAGQAVTFIDTATNAVKHATCVGRSPHEAFASDGKQVWLTLKDIGRLV